MFKNAVIYLLLAITSLASNAQVTLDSIGTLLANAPVQEKAYLHLDNTCYFKGDTIWYKSYVVRADDLTYTDMSRILYVELVSPDGLVVERQSMIVSSDGYGDGNFAIPDSLYSGYYELRAYTRWMLNFKVSSHQYTRTDREQFYNSMMARDFFRQYGTIYSRVVPIYERPDSAGGYSQKYIVNRPKTRLEKEQKENLTVNFYPEGGHLIAGTKCAVAFEALGADGEQVDVKGILELSGRNIAIATEHQGRGAFTIDVPENGSMKARFDYHGKKYTFDLPKVEKQGCALRLDASGDRLIADISLKGKGSSCEYGVAVLCRGVLKHFEKLTGDSRIRLDSLQLPTGVCDLIVIDSDGRAMADRLFFVNNHDVAMQPVTVSGVNDEYQPYDSIALHFQMPVGTKHISISVRDGASDDPTYDTGSIMTDLLLGSELKGFIPYPHYYFETDDEQHRRHLDLLMMVQGWRRYDYAEITRDVPLRYEPEKTLTVEGAVYKTVDFEDLRECEVPYWLTGIFGYCQDDEDHKDPNDPSNMKQYEESETLTTPDGSLELEEMGVIEKEAVPESVVDPEFGINHGGLGYEVVVNGELVVGKDVATVDMETTNGGQFMFNVPPFYGDGILFLSAHKKDISEKKLHKLDTKGRLDEDAWPEYYVKRNLFYPVFARKYDYYQCHIPEEDPLNFDSGYVADTGRISKFDTELDNIDVKSHRRRGRHAIDYSKPAYVYDAYELYNLATDYGLSFGKLNFRRFPIQVSMLLLGNYNSKRFFNVQARMSDDMEKPYLFYRNFKPDESVNTMAFRSNHAIASNLRLNRQNEIRLFTDFELRNEDKPIEQSTSVADVTLDFMLMPSGSKRYTYRDRRIIFHGMYEPDDFYHPDYSNRATDAMPADYRRTLYWNPNARPDEDGGFTARFYNNGKATRIKVSTAGVFR